MDPRAASARGVAASNGTLTPVKKDPSTSGPARGAARILRPAAALRRLFRRNVRRTWIAALVLGAAASAATFGALRDFESQRAHAQFHEAASQRLNEFETNLHLATERVQSLGAFFDATQGTGAITAERFERLASSLWSVDYAIQALSWNPKVGGPQRASWRSASETGVAPPR